MAAALAHAPDAPVDFGVLLNLAFGTFKARLHDELSRAGFDDVGPSFGYVFRLLAKEPLNLSAVAAALAISAPGALKIINDMADKGYVERLAHAGDARQKPIALTPRARQAMKAARRFHGQFEAALARQLGADDAQAARRVLEAIVAAAPAGEAQLRGV